MKENKGPTKFFKVILKASHWSPSSRKNVCVSLSIEISTNVDYKDSRLDWRHYWFRLCNNCGPPPEQTSIQPAKQLENVNVFVNLAEHCIFAPSSFATLFGVQLNTNPRKKRLLYWRTTFCYVFFIRVFCKRNTIYDLLSLIICLALYTNLEVMIQNVWYAFCSMNTCTHCDGAHYQC